MRAIQAAMAATLLGIFCAAGAQTPGVGETRPSAPEKKAPSSDAQKPAADAARDAKRCEELAGTLREDCLREDRAHDATSAAGATRRPEPPTAPPPQNPK
jgi:hypothetical protein